MELLSGVTATLELPAPDGDPVTLTGTVNVVATRASDGTKVEGTAVKTGEVWKFTLTGAQLPSPDRLTVTWKDATSTYTQQHEVVGGFVVPLVAIRRKLDEGTTPKDADIARAREVATRDIEAACGISFRPRYFNEQLRGKGRERLTLPRRELRSVVSVSVAGSAYTAGQVAGLGVDPLGVIVNTGIWPDEAITVGYISGYLEHPPAQVPVRDYAAFLMTNRPSDWMERATGVTTDMGSYSLVTAGERGNDFPLPAVNAFVARFDAPQVG